MAKQLNKTQINIITARLLEKAGSSECKEREDRHRAHVAREKHVTEVTQKWIDKNRARILRAVTLQVNASYGYDIRFQVASEVAQEFTKVIDDAKASYNVPPDRVAVPFIAIDRVIYVPAKDVEKWKALSKAIDMAALGGEWSNVINMIESL